MTARLLVLFLVLLLTGESAFARQAGDRPDSRATAQVCPVLPGETEPPDFSREECLTIPREDVDPQGRHIWVQMSALAREDLLASGRPLGLYVAGKMTSEVWLNGRLVGRNGLPGPDRASEIPGQMDMVFYLTPDLVRPGVNTVVLRLSAQRGLVHLGHPMHSVFIVPYANPTRLILQSYWPALITLLVFAVGFVSFGLLALRGEDRAGSALLALISLLAGLQLLAETARGFTPYLYYLHDARLIAIAIFAYAFGLCLFTLVSLKAARLSGIVRLVLLAATAAASLAAVFLAGGFDTKTALALVIPVVPAIGVSLLGTVQGVRQAPAWLAALIAFGILFVLSLGWFLDRYFYLSMAGFLATLFVLQIASLARERAKRRAGEALARQLQLALDQARERTTPSEIALTGAGRLDRLSTAAITHLQGAGDYVEIHREDGRPILHSGSLAALEDALPATFLKVHRSFIVNTAFVRSLTRDAGGTGVLTLSTGAELPVSRRVMPAVRKALAEG